MNKILLFVCLLIPAVCPAQDLLFRIISVKGSVTLDGRTITCGQRVTTSHNSLQITGTTSYATILTEKGFSFLISQGNYSVAEISKAEYSNIRKGAITREMPGPIVIVGDYNRNTPLYGDSLTVIARSTTRTATEYSLEIMDLMGNIIHTSASTNNVFTINVSDMYVEGAVVFHVKTGTRNLNSREYVAKRVQPKDRDEIAYNFDCISESDYIDRELSILALCEIHNLYLDQVHHLYKLWKYSQSTRKEITHAYYKQLTKVYELDKFLPVPIRD